MSELHSILTEEEKKLINDDIEKNGYLTVQNIIELYTKNQKENDYTLIDADLITVIDLRISDPIFITKDNIYKSDELISKYKLNNFKLSPESLFEKQVLELIENDLYIKKDSKGYVDEKKSTNREFNTRVYIAKEKWDEFLVMYKFMKSITFIQENRMSIEDNSENNNTIENIFNVFSK